MIICLLGQIPCQEISGSQVTEKEKDNFFWEWKKNYNYFIGCKVRKLEINPSGVFKSLESI